MKRLAIYGSGYLDVIKLIDAINMSKSTYEILGFINDPPEFQNTSFMGYPVLGGREIIPELVNEGDVCFFHNVNSTLKDRRIIASILENNGCEIVSLIHPATDMNYVEHDAGCIIPAGCTIGSNTRISRYLTCRLSSLISHDVTVKDFVYISPGVTCCSHVTIQEGCYIGAGATILPGVTIGAESVIGAGSTVLTDIPNDVVAFGTPAKIVKKRDSSEYRGRGM